MTRYRGSDHWLLWGGAAAPLQHGSGFDEYALLLLAGVIIWATMHFSRRKPPSDDLEETGEGNPSTKVGEIGRDEDAAGGKGERS